MLAMALVCAGVVIFAVRWVTVTFDRLAGRIEVRAVSLGGSETSRLVLIFSEETAAEIEPIERARLGRLKAIGLRRAGLTEIPLTDNSPPPDGARDQRMAAGR